MRFKSGSVMNAMRSGWDVGMTLNLHYGIRALALGAHA